MAELSNPKRDAAAFAALDSLPRLPFHQFVRQDREDLEEQWKKLEERNESPTFSYSLARAFNVDDYLASLGDFEQQLDVLCEDKTIAYLYQQKVDELRTRARLILAIQKENDVKVTELSENLFGSIPFSKAELEKEFADMLSDSSSYFVHERRVQRRDFKACVRLTLDHYGMQDWALGKTSSTSIKVKHGHNDMRPKILIPENFSVSIQRAARLIAHEIEVHALRTENGRRSPLMLLGRGLDRYIETEEGLAHYFQRQALPTHLRHEPGFWDAYATVLTTTETFVDTYQALKKARTALAKRAGHKNHEHIGKEAAWRLCLRAYRGITHTDQPGVGYRRDHIYRSGLRHVTDALKHTDGTLLQTLFLGNLSLRHVDAITALHFPQARLPDRIAAHIVESYMEKKYKT